MSEPPKLLPLRVPTGWIVQWNTLYEQEPVIENGVVVDNPNDSEDLLWIQRFERDRAKEPWLDFHIDVGWYGEEQGTFRVVLHEGDWEHIVKTFESRSIYAIRICVENWLAILTEYGAAGYENL
jgi:hypothetical protein